MSKPTLKRSSKMKKWQFEAFIFLGTLQFQPIEEWKIVNAEFCGERKPENNHSFASWPIKIKKNGKLEEIDITFNSEANGLGTGAAVADIDKDGILELLIAHGETGNQILTLYKANVKKDKNYLELAKKVRLQDKVIIESQTPKLLLAFTNK